MKLSDEQAARLMQRYNFCKQKLAELDKDVDYAISEAERPYEYEVTLENAAIELIEVLEKALSLVEDNFKQMNVFDR